MVLLKNPNAKIIDQMNWGTPDEDWNNYNDGLWNPGLTPSGNGGVTARIKTSSNPDVFQDTDLPADWKNLELPQVDLTYPVGGEVWYVGKTYDITWNATNPNGNDADLNISLYYSNDSGATWGLIINSTENDGTYTWKLPLFTNGYYVPSHVSRIKIVATKYETLWFKQEMNQMIFVLLLIGH